MFDLSGKVALITGGAIGLGKAFGEVLAEYGADIAIADIDEATARRDRRADREDGKAVVCRES